MPTVKIKGDFAVEDLPVLNMIVIECFFAIMFFTCRAAEVIPAEIGFGLLWFIISVLIYLKVQFYVTSVMVTKHYILIKHGNDIKYQIPMGEVRSVEIGKNNKVKVVAAKTYTVGKMPQAESFRTMITKILNSGVQN